MNERADDYINNPPAFPLIRNRYPSLMSDKIKGKTWEEVMTALGIIACEAEMNGIKITITGGQDEKCGGKPLS